MMDFALEIEGDTEVMRYPHSRPWTLRDQGVRRWDDTIKTVLDDVATLLAIMKEEFQELEDKATELLDEAEALDEDDEFYQEVLIDILQSAEQLDHIMIDWNGDAGTVTVSISDYWYEYEGDTNDV